MVTGSNALMALATAAYCFLAGTACGCGVFCSRAVGV
jgi:hypothetical protein